MLGAILLSDRTMYSLVIEEMLRPEDFYRDSHGTIFAAMLDLYERSEPIDTRDRDRRAAQPPDRSRRRAAPDAVDLLAGRGPERREPAPLRAASCATPRCCGGCSAPPTRSSRACSTSASRRARSSSTPSGSMLEVAHAERRRDFRSISSLLHDELDKLHELSVAGEKLTGHADRLHRPRPHDRRPAAGKPDRDRGAARRWARAAWSRTSPRTRRSATRKPVALFSLEMSEAELARRFIASQASVRGEDLAKGRVPEATWPKIVKAELAPRAGAAVDRRLRRHRHARDPREGPPAVLQQPGRARTRDRRLPAAAALRVAQRQPRRGDRPDVARTQAARARARRAGRSRSRSSTAASSRATRRSRCSRTCASRARSSRTPTS